MRLIPEQYLAISPYNKEHYFVAFRDRTIKYNFVGAPPEWMQQMQEVFSQWQAEIAQQLAPPGVTPYSPQPQPQQWHMVPAQPPPQSGYMSPQLLPNSPMSTYSGNSPHAMSPNLSPAMSPNAPPAIFAHQTPITQFAPVEMMGSLPQGPLMGGMLASPASQMPVQTAPSVVSAVALVILAGC